MFLNTHAYIIVFILLGFFIQLFFPRKINDFRLKEILKESKWYFLSEFLISSLLVYMTINISSYVNSNFNIPSINLKNLPTWIQLLIFVIVLDFTNYLTHLSTHYYRLLWPIHKLHHSVKNLTPLSTFRHSLLEQLYFFTTMGIVSSFFSVSAYVRETTYLISMFADILQHANTSIRLPHFLNYFFILPDNHYLHHSKKCHKTYGQNFGLIFSVWDIMFSTFYLPKRIDTEIGLSNDDLPKSFIKRILYPIF